MKVIPVKCLHDNYAYVLSCSKTSEAALVDAVEPKKVLEAANASDYTIKFVLTTHHHVDHAGGNSKLKKLLPDGTPFYGGDDRIPELTKEPPNSFKLGSITIRPIRTPCHTTGHVCYYCEDDDGDKCVFTGDTLFIGGCGRFFEGTGKEMTESLEKLTSFPKDTKVWCGHEYTVSNLKFAKHVEPENAKIAAKLEWALKTPVTIPSTIESELETNPFVRVSANDTPWCGRDKVEVMNELREQKNTFKT